MHAVQEKEAGRGSLGFFTADPAGEMGRQLLYQIGLEEDGKLAEQVGEPMLPFGIKKDNYFTDGVFMMVFDVQEGCAFGSESAMSATEFVEKYRKGDLLKQDFSDIMPIDEEEDDEDDGDGEIDLGDEDTEDED